MPPCSLHNEESWGAARRFAPLLPRLLLAPHLFHASHSSQGPQSTEHNTAQTIKKWRQAGLVFSFCCQSPGKLFLNAHPEESKDGKLLLLLILLVVVVVVLVVVVEVNPEFQKVICLVNLSDLNVSSIVTLRKYTLCFVAERHFPLNYLRKSNLHKNLKYCSLSKSSLWFLMEQYSS